MIKISYLFNLLRVKQYIKNIIIFLPLVYFSKNIDINILVLIFWTFIAFCLVSSSVYIFNDIKDVNTDKIHPVKRFRPIASGLVSTNIAWVIFIFLAFFSFIISFFINKLVLTYVIFYFILNIFYSIKLKKIPIIDVLSIALGFVLRILAACVAIKIVPTNVLIFLIFITSLFFTFSKRKLEYSLLNKNIRNSIKVYSNDILNKFILITAILSVGFYYIFMSKTNNIFYILTTIIYGSIIFRIFWKIYSTNKNDDPTEFIYKDNILKILIILFVLLLFIFIIIF